MTKQRDAPNARTLSFELANITQNARPNERAGSLPTGDLAKRAARQALSPAH